MTAHILNPNLDPELPATLSPKILKDLLRKDLRYTRIIVSDDMEMQAITDHFGAEDAPRRAVEAGCDLLIYRSETAARHAYHSLSLALENEKILPEVVLEAAQRLQSHKKDSLIPHKEPLFSEIKKIIGCAEHQAIVAKIPG